LKTETLPSCI